MLEHGVQNNDLVLVGNAVSDLTLSHTVYGEDFNLFYIEVPRLSGSSDVLPVIISERLLSSDTDIRGKYLKISGQFRSYNQSDNGKNRLVLSVFATDIKQLEDSYKAKVKNKINLYGYICKPPIYRITPFGREITDLLVAINRAYHKSDYIPCITWGRNAKYSKDFQVGDFIQILGRVQQRDYQKKEETGEIVTKTAYEVSVSRIEKLYKK